MTGREVPLGVAAVVAAAAFGMWWSEFPFVVLLGAAAIAAGLVGYLRTATRRRLSTVLAHARALGSYDGEASRGVPDPGWQGLPEWQAVIDELARARSELSRRVGDLAAERAHVMEIVEGLPPPILLFSDHGLTYANSAARRVFRLDDVRTATGEHLTPMQVLGIRELADAVEATWVEAVPQEVESSREARVFLARTSRTAQGEVVLVLTDLTQSRRLDAVRRDFVTNASHELKTPVAGIQALADSLGLAMSRDPQRAARMITRIQDEATRLATLVRELLDLARVEEFGGGQPVTRIDVSTIVRSQIDRLQATIDEEEVLLTSSLAAGAWVQASVEDVRLVVGNLIQNAVRYNHPGGTVTVTLTHAPNAVVLEVADTGIGISEHDLQRVFERFYRVDKARSRAAGGTGLGLSLVRHATQRMGGEVSVTSVLGQGSTFVVELPAAPEPGNN